MSRTPSQTPAAPTPRRDPATAARLRSRTLLLGAIPLVILVTLFFLPTIPGTEYDTTVPFAAEGEGPTFNTLGDVEGKPVVEITGTDTEATTGNLNMTTVAVRTRMSLAQALSRSFVHGDTLIPVEMVIPQGTSMEKVDEENQAAFMASESNATVAAMNYLGRPMEAVVADVAKDSAAADAIKVNDIILKFADADIASAQDLVDAVRAHSPGETAPVVLRRGGEEKTVPVTLGSRDLSAVGGDKDSAFLGVTAMTQPADGVRVNYNLDSVGGPSAGLIFSLAVIDKLTSEEITGGKFIAGTGTIGADGQVGAIGGIRHKIRAAAGAGAEAFLVPAGNCAEAMAESDATNPEGHPITLIKVDTLRGALDELEHLRGDGQVTTCS